eukprot:CAMPEP_0118979612 /NCGR_PEP_ID=MMETSP1173-20130426/26369_1 /TAXON_ID=1034831 /ORGANISM="Rhizochromulina marina cf, Strain CCMP1243" /LENGTH=309 /DNA_ID=CAMNT_0006929883 /DNA_START=37 /DNA_END=966 /DNA_ORIENTATION=+
MADPWPTAADPHEPPSSAPSAAATTPPDLASPPRGAMSFFHRSASPHVDHAGARQHHQHHQQQPPLMGLVSALGGLKLPFAIPGFTGGGEAQGREEEEEEGEQDDDLTRPDEFRQTLTESPKEWGKPQLLDSSDIVNSEQVFQIESMLPLATQGYRWKLLYSSLRHGCDISTFYSKVKLEKRTVVLVETLDGEVFGSFSSMPWKVQVEYFGTGESFLFSFGNNDRTNGGTGSFQSDCRFFPWTAENNLVMMATDEFIAMGGGGGSFGYILEENFSRGTTGTCDTYRNTPLCSSSPFEVTNVEVWGFVPV